VGCGSEKRPELRPEQLWLVEANPDGPPSQEGIVFSGHVEKLGKLVPADVKGPDHDCRIRKGLDDMAIRFVLLLFPGEVGASDHEEFGSKEAYALSPVTHGEVSLPG
jgi:hypothetical protein